MFVYCFHVCFCVSSKVVFFQPLYFKRGKIKHFNFYITNLKAHLTWQTLLIKKNEDTLCKYITDSDIKITHCLHSDIQFAVVFAVLYVFIS